MVGVVGEGGGDEGGREGDRGGGRVRHCGEDPFTLPFKLPTAISVL